MARNQKSDIFYTRYEDIKKEVEWHKEHFKGQRVLSPCDDPEKSNFSKFFLDNFDNLGLESFTATCFNPNPGGKGRGMVKTREKVTFFDLEGNGDFRSDEIRAFRDNSDIIVTNPPFSLFQDFVTFCLPKKFLALGSNIAPNLKTIFPLFQSGEVYYGASHRTGRMYFYPGDGMEHYGTEKKYDEDGNVMFGLGNVRWFTNMENRIITPPLKTMEEKRQESWRIYKNPKAYRKYDNFDALEVPSINAIPGDYNGVMGVPINYFDKHDPELFEVLGMKAGLTIDGGSIFKRFLIQRKNRWELSAF